MSQLTKQPSYISESIMILIVLLTTDPCSGVWSYHNTLNDEQMFTLQNAIFLDYDGSDFVEWEYPNTCSLTNKSAPHSIMRCTVPGFQLVKPRVSSQREEEEARLIHVKDSSFSLTWYSVMPLNRDSPDKCFKKVRSWIIDPEHADQAEVNNTAVLPSKYSFNLTGHFYNHGQYPTVHLSSTETLLSKFNDKGYWEADIPGERCHVNLRIVSQSVVFQDRLVSSLHALYWSEPQGRIEEQTLPLRLAQGSPLQLVWSTCQPNRCLMLSDLGTFQTDDGFLTSREIKVGPGALAVPDQGYFTVESAALLEDGIIFMIKDGLYWCDSHTYILTSDPQLPLTGVRGISFRRSCVNYFPLKDKELPSLLVWLGNILYTGSKRFTGPRGGASFLQTSLITPAATTIMTASFGSYPVSTACLVMWNNGDLERPILILSHWLLPATTDNPGEWRASTFLTKLKPEEIPQGPFHMHFLYSAQASLLLWNNEKILFSFQNDNKWGFLYSDNSTDLSLASQHSSIHQVVLDRKGGVLVKMNNNVIFYCTVGMAKLVRLPSWSDPEAPMVLYLDQNDQFSTVTLTPQGQLHLRRYPLQMEKKSVMHGSLPDCPYIFFEHSLANFTIYYLDKGERVEHWAQLVHPEGEAVHIAMLFTNRHLLKMAQKSKIYCVHSVYTVKTTWTFYQRMDYSETDRYTDLMRWTSGVLTLEVVPSQMRNTCKLPPKRISHFHVGCPPNKHIRVARPWAVPCGMPSENYTIPRSVLGNQPEEDVVVGYDGKKYGCMMEIHYKSTFLPSLDLYDGDRFLKNVDANFIVWEAFGRQDYSFNKTMRQVGCMREAQTWRSMLLGGKGVEEAWGPENYRSCFKVTSGELGYLDQIYEVLNRSGTNRLTFSQDNTAIYLFNVKVLDPNYSFCDLRAVFAIQTYGVPPPKSEHFTEYMVLVFTFALVCSLVFSYWMYGDIFRRDVEAREKIKQ